MTFVVTESCIRCKHTDCVEVCPADAFREGENFLAISPDDCIDCALCVPECPVEAIYAESDLPEQFKADIEFNATQAHQIKDSGREAIVKKKEALPTAPQRKKELGF